ncbi:MAG: hypothetical protein DHS20C16_04850 [Phycisphaerae bacterium]|nr:MAG: hypothetical protein DHS20C16_04850 [Phycisphaerae bacterium]
MALQKRMCANHEDRIAIGVCVITKAPICAECSTRYEGVNYSREGLAILKEQRAKASASGMGHKASGVLIGLLLSPLLIYAHFLFFEFATSFFIDLHQLDLFDWLEA